MIKNKLVFLVVLSLGMVTGGCAQKMAKNEGAASTAVTGSSELPAPLPGESPSAASTQEQVSGSTPTSSDDAGPFTRRLLTL